MNMSEQIDKISPALVAIQDEMTVEKDAESVHNARYATHAKILKTIRPVLKENGLTVFQSMDTNEKTVTCTTRTLHTSCQWADSFASVTAVGLSPQQLGGAITYVKRYGISAALSIAITDDDDDAETSEKNFTKAEEKEALAVELRKYKAAVMNRLLKYDAECLGMAFEEIGAVSDAEDKESMLVDLLEQVHSKEKLLNVGKRAKALQEEVDAPLKKDK